MAGIELTKPSIAAEVLSNQPALESWDTDAIAQIVPYVTECIYSPGEYLCSKGTLAEYAFCLLEGRVCIQDAGLQEVFEGIVAEEAAIGLVDYVSDIVAVDTVRALLIPGPLMRRSEPSRTSSKVYEGLFRRFIPNAREQIASLDKDILKINMTDLFQRLKYIVTGCQDPSDTRQYIGKWRLAFSVVGWLATVLLPMLILLLGGTEFDLSWHQRQYLAALSICLVMWLFDLIPQYGAVMVAALACLVLGAVPSGLILSGFSAGGFYMALSIFALGTVLVKSGLTHRLVLFNLRYSPRSAFWYNFNTLILGILLTPALPSANARIGLLTPYYIEMSRTLGFKDKSPEATRLMLSMFMGCSIFAPIFLTSKSLNFVLYDMLPQQVSEEYQFWVWMFTASVAGVALLLLYTLFSSLIFRGGTAPKLSRLHVDMQMQILGPLRTDEWIALGAVLFFILAIICYTIHKISPFWVTLGFFYGFLVLGILREHHVRHNIDWSALLLIGFFIGLEDALEVTGISQIMLTYLSGMTHWMPVSFDVFVLLMIVVIFVIRIFLPITTAGIMVGGVFLPLAKANGVDPWVMAFVIMMVAECWFLPSQCSYYLTMESIAHADLVIDKPLFLRINAITVGLRLIALFLALAWFRKVGIL